MTHTPAKETKPTPAEILMFILLRYSAAMPPTTAKGILVMTIIA